MPQALFFLMVSVGGLELPVFELNPALMQHIHPLELYHNVLNKTKKWTLVDIEK